MDFCNYWQNLHKGKSSNYSFNINEINPYRNSEQSLPHRTFPEALGMTFHFIMYKKLLFVIYVDIPELKFISINATTDQYVSCLPAEKKMNCEYHFQVAGGVYFHGRGTFF